MLSVRRAEEEELAWVNQCYDEVDFVHSDFDKEIIAIAESEGKKVGLGRLVTVDQKHLELGGMYVFASHRGKGVAKEIVKYLLSYAKPLQIVYCIPFENLLPFYQQFGFVRCDDLHSVPKKILDKYRWCQEKYPQPTELLVLK